MEVGSYTGAVCEWVKDGWKVKKKKKEKSSVNPFAGKSGKLGNVIWKYFFRCSLYVCIDVDEQKHHLPFALFLLLLHLDGKCNSLWIKIVQQSEKRVSVCERRIFFLLQGFFVL